MNKLAMALVEPVFTTTYRVIYGDTDAAGVMYNANYLRLFEIGRTEMMRAWAMSYLFPTRGYLAPRPAPPPTRGCQQVRGCLAPRP